VKEIWPSRRTVAPIGEAGKHEHRHGSARPPEQTAGTHRTPTPQCGLGCGRSDRPRRREIDICTEPALARFLAAQLQPARHLTSLVVDLSSVTFIGVRGFAALLTAATNARHRDVAFCVAACSPPVLRLLALIDPNHTLTVRADSGRASRPRSSGCARTRHRSTIRSIREEQ
jgi:anti-anti-sigma factor